jgi:hypothetical protein
MLLTVLFLNADYHAESASRALVNMSGHEKLAQPMKDDVFLCLCAGPQLTSDAAATALFYPHCHHNTCHILGCSIVTGVPGARWRRKEQPRRQGSPDGLC